MAPNDTDDELGPDRTFRWGTMPPIGGNRSLLTRRGGCRKIVGRCTADTGGC